MKNLKHSTRQRFVALEFDFPPPSAEVDIVVHETGVDRAIAEDLVKLAGHIRHLRDKGLEEPASTRLLVYAGQLIRSDVPIARACELAIASPITDDLPMQQAIRELIASVV